MGVEAAVAAGAILGGIGTIAGAAESRKAGKRARREAELDRQETEKLTQETKKQKDMLLNAQKEAQKRVDRGRKRLRGGLFGDDQASTSDKLG